jgi:hypothetical protein
MKSASPRSDSATVPTGCVKSFGPFGPKYEVGLPLRPLGDGVDWLVEVTLIDSGERVEYRLSKLLDDPKAP